MDYPVWYLPSIGGGTLIALIAIVHVFVSHFAVGGGLFLVLSERKALREKNSEIFDFTRRHTRFFLLLTMVFGAITGVGIWFVIALVQPAATSFLIHTFVFGWATEWVFFFVEIVAILAYYYGFEKMSPVSHQRVGWIYFISAWFSLFLINGIIGFMLTPGEWAATHNFWDAFFNPSFWPSLFFRSFVSFMLAGVYALIMTAFTPAGKTRETMTRFSAKWIVVSLMGTVITAVWYLGVLPDPVKELLQGGSPTLQKTFLYTASGVTALFVITLLVPLTRPARHNKGVALVTMLCALCYMGGFEWTREAARRPYVIYGLMYSNGIMADQVDALSQSGFLGQLMFKGSDGGEPAGLLQKGEMLFKHQCYSCHTLGGINNDLVVRTASMDFSSFNSYLARMHQIRPFMPPFAGTEGEARALAAYFVEGHHGKAIEDGLGVGASEGALFKENCLMCHGEEVVIAWGQGRSQQDIRDAMDHLSQVNPLMPDYDGTDEEKDKIAGYIYSKVSPPVGADGEVVFMESCSYCHTLQGEGNPLIPKVKGWGLQRIRNALDHLDELSPAMPPFEGSEADKDRLANFLYGMEQGGVQ